MTENPGTRPARVAILSRNLPPARCGIGDHAIQLARELRRRGHVVIAVGGVGNAGDGRIIVPEFWKDVGQAALIRELEVFDPTDVVLQYTPLAFAGARGFQDDAIERMWKSCSQRWNSYLVAHETYFVSARHPPSWIKGPLEKRRLQRLVAKSHAVFSASQTLVEEMSRWSAARIVRLPIGSNVERVAMKKENARTALGFERDDMVLTLFGGGTALKWQAGHVRETAALLHRAGVRARWLLLGGAEPGVLPPGARAEIRSWLEPEMLSMHLLASDLFLVPHYGGLSAKRGTVMAAMQHALAIAGTRGPMTDGFWAEVSGVKLFDNKEAFGDGVLALCRDRSALEEPGRSNAAYFEKHFDWRVIGDLYDEATRPFA